MKTYYFSLKLDIRSFDALDVNLDRLYKSGCDDGLINETKDGVFIDFSRRANSLDEAVESATADVEKAKYKVSRYVR